MIRPTFINSWVVSMISPKYSLLHRKTTAIFVSFMISESCPVLSGVSIVKKSSVSSHSLQGHCFTIVSTSYHEIHAQSVVGLLPNVQTFSQIISVHHDIPQSQCPLKPNFRFMNTTQSSLMDSYPSSRHTRQGAYNSRIPKSKMRNLTINVINCNQFVLIYPCICLPIQISHSEKTIIGSFTPNSEERTMHCMLFNELLYCFFNQIDAILYLFFYSWVLNSEKSHHFINKDCDNVVSNVSWKGRYDQNSLYIDIQHFVTFFCPSKVNTPDFIQELQGQLFLHIDFILKIQE